MKIKTFLIKFYKIFYLDWHDPHAVDHPQTSALLGIFLHRSLPGSAEGWTSDQSI